MCRARNLARALGESAYGSSPATWMDAGQLREATGTDRYLGGIRFPQGGKVNPRGYARGLAAAAQGAGAQVFGGSPATGIARHGGGWRVNTPRGDVSAEHLVIATNAYTDDLWPGLRRSLVPGFGQAAHQLRQGRTRKSFRQFPADAGLRVHAENLSRRFVEGGHPVVVVDHDDAVGQALQDEVEVIFDFFLLAQVLLQGLVFTLQFEVELLDTQLQVVVGLLQLLGDFREGMEGPSQDFQFLFFGIVLLRFGHGRPGLGWGRYCA